MSIIQHFTDYYHKGKVSLQYGTSFLYLSKDEMITIFGSSFAEESIKGRDWNYTLFFEENDRMFFVSYECISHQYKFVTSTHEQGVPQFYREPSDVYLKHFQEEYTKKARELAVYERVLNHPKNRLKTLYF